MQYNDLSIKLNNSLEIARSLKKPEIKDNALIVSDTSSRPAAKILYISLLNSGYSPFLYTPAEISVYVLPYNEKYSNIIIFSSSQKDSRAVHAAEVATIMNYNVTFISPNMNEALEERLDYLKVNRIKINSENPVITMSLASLIWSPPLMGFREDRIRKEISEIGSSYDWLINN
ncbi:MAG: hypothetical protein RAK17_01310, partial [Caldisphaera sp.]|nr:hypothetical protein [Caldisphaera sp.]